MEAQAEAKILLNNLIDEAVTSSIVPRRLFSFFSGGSGGGVTDSRAFGGFAGAQKMLYIDSNTSQQRIGSPVFHFGQKIPFPI